MNKELLTLLRKGKGQAIQILLDEDEESAFKVMKYALTHNMSNYNSLGRYLFYIFLMKNIWMNI